MARIDFVKTDALPSLPLPLYRVQNIAYGVIEPFGECSIVVGLDRELVSQLIERSQDIGDDALAHTSDSKRFMNLDTYESWYKKTRTPFALIQRSTDTLMALTWIGPKPLGMKPPKLLSEETELHSVDNQDTTWDTLTFRSYPPYRGNGFMTSFVEYILTEYRNENPTRKIWVGISQSNVASIGLARKLGFITEEERERDSDRIIMTLT